MDAADVVGCLGAACLLLAYFLNQGGWLRSDDWRFPAINLAGSGLVVVSLFAHYNLPSMVIEVFWSSISLYGIWKSVRAGRGGALASAPKSPDHEPT